MKSSKRIANQEKRRSFRIRNRVRRDAHGRPRLSVFRSNKHIYAQVIDDQSGNTVASASSLDKAIAGPGKYAGNTDAAIQVGKLVAERALEKGVKEIAFDRGTYKYHGRVAALATAAREAGLDF